MSRYFGPSSHGTHASPGPSAVSLPARAVLMLLVLLLGGCSEEPPLRVGVLVWPPYEMAYLARDLGYFEDARIELVDYESPAVVQRAYREGNIDVVAMTSHYLLDLAQTSDDHRVPLIIDSSHGGDALVVRPDITSLAQLKGARIGVESGSLGAYILLRVLDHAGLTLNDIVRVSADIPVQERMFTSGEVDAVITYDPIRTRLLATGARVLFDSSDIPDEIVDVLIVRENTAEQRSDEVEALVGGWLRALDYFNANQQDAAARMAPREQLTPDELLAALTLVRMPNRAQNVQMLSGADAPFERALATQRDTMARAGMLTQVPTISGIGEPRFVLVDPN